MSPMLHCIAAQMRSRTFAPTDSPRDILETVAGAMPVASRRYTQIEPFSVSAVFKMVGASGFEPETFCTPSKRATRLRYAPMGLSPAKQMVGPEGLGPSTPALKVPCSTN